MQAEFTEIGFHVEVHSFIATPHKIQFHCYQFSLLSHQTNVLNTLFSVLPCLHSAGIVLFQISVSVYLSFYELVLCLQYSSCENPTLYWEWYVVNNHWTGILKWKTGLDYQIDLVVLKIIIMPTTIHILTCRTASSLRCIGNGAYLAAHANSSNQNDDLCDRLFF